MTNTSYIKIVINLPVRDLFTYLQNNILYEDIEMFYFPNLLEISQFLQRIRPHILLTYVNKETISDKKIHEFFKSDYFDNIWIIFMASPEVKSEDIMELGEFKKSMIIYEESKPDVIAYNIKTILGREKFDLKQSLSRKYAQNLLKSSKIINEENAISTIFEKLTHFLPKILPYDYWALFTFDHELKKIEDFWQFIPPHKRTNAILTSNLEKLAEIWINRSKTFRVDDSEDKQLFRKLNDWGWGVKQLYFYPMAVHNVPVGGLLLGNMNIKGVSGEDAYLLREINEMISRKIYNLLRQRKSPESGNDFAEQLIYNRFSEDSILQLSCKKINEIAEGDTTVFWQINRGFGFLFPKFIYARENQGNWQSLEKNMLFLAKDPKLNNLISTETITLIEKLSVNGGFAEATQKTFKKLGYQNLLVSPVQIENEEIGLFIANREKQENEFTPWDVDRVEQIMEKIQRVLEDTHVVKEANLKLKQLSRIFELGNEIKLDLHIEDILSRIIQSIRKSLGWNDVAVLRTNEFRKTYKPISKIGFDNKKTLPIDIFNQLSFNQFEKFLVNCKQISNSYFYDSHPVNIKENGNSYLNEVVVEWHDEDLVAIPLETRKKVLGFLMVRDPVDRLKPNKDKIVSLEYFANQAAVAIENSMLYENLSASEERYRALAETMTLGLVTCSPDSKIVYVNPAFEKLVGLNSRSLSKKPLKNFFSRESQTTFDEITEEILESSDQGRKNIENMELELISINGETIPVSTFVFPFYQQQQKIGLFLVLNDLRVAKKLERLKADFNSMIVHDLRSPMNVIQGFVELIRTRVVGEINSEQEELLDIAKENVKKVLTLIDNFLVASKIEVGKFGIEPKVSELNPLIERIVENHRVLIKNKNITIDAQLNENLPLLYFDSFRIEQVLNNFLSNAMKFTPENGNIKVTSDFHQKTIKGEKKMFVRIGVHDSGPGIPPQELNNIFNKYEQADSEESIKSAGTGLGLSICKEIVSLHGGEIWAESELKKGSCFYFTLPIEPTIDKYMK